MDLSLPVLSGWDAARRLKAAEGTRGIPIIALSAHALEGERDKALAAGCDDFETKPVDLPRLLEKMRACFGGTPPCSTMVFVSRLAAPVYKVEIEAWASRGE